MELRRGVRVAGRLVDTGTGAGDADHGRTDGGDSTTTPAAPTGCAEAVEHLWELLDWDISEADRAALDAHLSFCVRCCGELAFAEELRKVLRERSQVPLPSDVEDRLDRFIDTLDDEPGAATP